ncbi:hypothetical protein [Salinarimonas rosea]|uniref:hypothetical protein n=1 Tax=Salinarimonas rosea TaxID=552063 RepID=UPI00041C3005|nr:hypothetical protein [Salinarimonas rosea]
MSALFPADKDTYLDFSEIGVVHGSGAGIRQTIEPVPNGRRYYDVFGRIHDTGRPALQLYRTTILGEDVWGPALAGVWPGRALTISCAAELVQPASLAFVRPAVPGSVRYLDALSNDLPDATGAVYVAYRPILQVKVQSWNVEQDEYGQVVAWTMEAWEDGA